MIKKVWACVPGVLLAVLLAPATAATADTTDSDFNNYLSAHGITLGGPAQTVKMARVMCQDLDAGYTQRDEVDQITGAHRLNQAQAQLFVGAATAEYCPSHHNSTPPKK